MKVLSILFLFTFLSANTLFSQNVGIGTQTPDASALLDLTSSNKGMLLPRMTTEQRKAIANPAVGLQVLNLDDMCMDMYDGVNWIKFCGLKVTGPGNVDPNHPAANTWLERANFINARSGAVGFTIGNKGYAGTGRDIDYKTDFWEFDITTGAWTQKADVGGPARADAVGFVINGKGYIGTGSTSGPVKSDLWEYNPPTNSWTQKTSIPGGTGRYSAFAFVINDKGYIGSGAFGGNTLWEFDPSTDSWQQKAGDPVATGPVGGRQGAASFAIGNKGYIVAGFCPGPPVNGLANDCWEYNPATNLWTQKASIPATTRGYSTGFTINDLGYVACGYFGADDYTREVWRYNPALDSWNQRTSFGGPGRVRAFAFVIGKKAFMGTGGGLFNFTNYSDMWEYVEEPDSGLTYSTNPFTNNMNIVTDGKWTSSLNNVYNANGGNIGIGTTTPTTKLEVAGTIKTTGFQLPTGAFNNGILRSDASGNASWALIQETDPKVGALSTHRIPRWNGSALSDGSLYDVGGAGIGIGTGTIHASLQFVNGTWNRKIVLHEDADNDHQYHGFGVNVNALRYQVTNTGASHIFYAGVNSSSSVELMRVQGNGYVGIGTAGGAQAPLHVAGSPATAPNQQRAYFHVNSSSIVQDVNASGNIILRADGWIWANGGGFIATSDARIKNIIGITDNQNDLATIEKIRITNYKYKDEISNGSGLQKKVIAQQVKEVYPVAVNQSAGVIPNVFAIAKNIKTDKDKTIITTSKPHEFASGDEVKLIFNKSGEKIYPVVMIDAVTFSIPVATTEDIFVYGKKVNDLLNVDYDALTTLNISATQQLKKEVEQLKKETEQLKAENVQMRTDMQKSIAELVKRLEVFAGK